MSTAVAFARVPRRRAPGAFAAAAALASLVILWLGRGLTFFADEWAFIESRSLADPAGWFAPHNEHWSMLPVVVYRVLIETVGLRTYLPYLVLLVALHIAVAALALVLVRRRTNGAVALAASVVVLFFGSGFENLYWGFQIGFVGSVAIGLAVLAVLDEPPTGRRAVAAALLLVAGLATSGIGIFFLTAVAAEVALRADWRRHARVLLGPPIVAYVGWFALGGWTGIGAHRDPFTLASLAHVPSFLVAGLGDAVGGALGVGPTIGAVIGVGVVGWVAWATLRGRPAAPRAVGSLIGIATAYALIALTRAGVTVDQVHYSRYTYVAGVLAIIGLSALLGPWLAGLASWSPRRRFGAVAAGVLVLELSLLWNVRLLVEGRALFVERAAMTRALVAAALEPERPAGSDLDRSLVLVPSPRSLERIVAAHGSPLADVVWGSEVEPLRSDLLAEARRRLVEGPPTNPAVED